MPKNKLGGKSHKRKKNQKEDFKRELIFKEHEQEYAVVTKMLGNGRVRIQCFDNQERLGIIRGKMKKRVWIRDGDFVLVGLRDFQNDKADIIHKYTADEARQLKAFGEIPITTKINATADFEEEEEDCAFDFDTI